MSAATRSRIQDLLKLRANLFNQNYNPSLVRTGAKILRQRLKGEQLKEYYPPRYYTIKDLARKFPKFDHLDFVESERVEDLTIRQARGKGNPKKKRTAEESKKFTKKRGK